MWPRRSSKRSAGNVIRHDQFVSGKLSTGDPALTAAIDAHVTKHYDEPALVWHELVSPNVHIDVLIVDPAPGRPTKLLVTSGMSERAMADANGPLHAELLMALPPEWEIADAEGRPSWPITLLQTLASFPHDYDTVLWTGHTVPNDDPPEPYASSTRLCGVILAPPLLTADGFDELDAGDRNIRFLAVIPLHAAEMNYKLEHGADALFDLLDAADLTETLDEHRPSVV
jgi:hypothetical protein